eukprot:gene4465-7846_t
MLSEERLSKAIHENKLDELKDMILDGLNINRKYKYPVGCQYLVLNHEEMNLSGYYLPYIDGDSSGQYIDDFQKKFGGEIQWTPLMLASAYGRHSIINLLISKGANINEIDASGKTAKEIAEEFEHKVNFDGDGNIVSKLELKVSNLKKENEFFELKVKELEEKIQYLEKRQSSSSVKNSNAQVETSKEEPTENTNIKAAIYDYDGDEGALSIKTGEKFEILDVNGEWCCVINIATKEEGWVPTDYLQ